MSVSDGATSKRVEKLAVVVEDLLLALNRETSALAGDNAEDDGAFEECVDGVKNLAAALNDVYSVFHAERLQLETLLEDESYEVEDGDDPVDPTD